MTFQEYINRTARELKNHKRPWVFAKVDEYDHEDNWWDAHFIPAWTYSSEQK